MSSNLKLVIMPNIIEFGTLVDENLKLIRNEHHSNIVHLKLDRFSNGEGKATLRDTVRGQDVFVLSDVGNYGEASNYISRGKAFTRSPDDHFQDIKRVLSAMNGKADSVHVVTPLLYQSRQDKRHGCESLDCAQGLRELENMGVNGIITFDVHNAGVENALQNCSFDNLYPTYSILKTFVENEDFDPNNLMIVAPDTGAMDRAVYYATALGVDVGVFYKRRDFTKVENGKNPIVDHKFLGSDVKGKDLIITDDMIASGSSILEVAEDMKSRGANKIYLVATFPLFTEGQSCIDRFEKAHKDKKFYKLYTTNITYVPEDVRKREWFTQVDCSKYLAKIINAIYEHESIKPYQDGREKIVEKLKTLGKYPTKKV